MTTADAADEAALVGHAERLADALAVHLPDWIERCIRTRVRQAGPGDDDRNALVDEAVVSARTALAEGELADLRTLLLTDIDQQRVAPLSLIRSAVAHPTASLVALEIAPVDRPEFDREQFPDDHYHLTPAAWADVHPDLHELGLAWGAAKAFVHLARRRSEGKR